MFDFENPVLGSGVVSVTRTSEADTVHVRAEKEKRTKEILSNVAEDWNKFLDAIS